MFQDISPIQDFTGNLVLEFIDYSLGEPKYTVDDAKERDVTYAAPLRVKVRLINKETGEVRSRKCSWETSVNDGNRNIHYQWCRTGYCQPVGSLSQRLFQHESG